MRKFPLILLFILIVIGCSNQSNQSLEDQTLVNQLMADSDSEGLPFWTADTIKKTNPELVLLLDTLYRYVRREDYPSINLSEKREWMENYRNKLGGYYNRKHLGPDSVSLLDKANLVILTADRLWALDNNESTMGMVVNDGSTYTRRQFQEFNYFEKLLSLSESPEYTKAMEEEFAAWQDLQMIIEEIAFNLSSILYHGGSIRGVMNGNSSSKILMAHINIYKRDYSLLTNFPYTSIDYGVIPEGGRDLLSFCINGLIKESEYYLSSYEPKDQESLKSDYDALITAYKNLPGVIDNWIAKRKEVSSFAADNQSNELNLHTGELLVRLSNVISSLQ
ncbi:MAG: hypothetical protein J1F07_06055 [Muribaculaceae bacterium]|nr:hypothetical protein [Muribaculaceae bacterium]